MNLPIYCQEKTGFLIMHKCKNPADSQCTHCGKYICAKHTHIHASAAVCESCFKKLAPQEYQKMIHTRSSYYPAGYHSYTPFYYNDSDYSHFDRGDSAFHEDAGES